MKQKRVLFVHQGAFNRFKQIDLDILKSAYQVREAYCDTGKLKDILNLFQGVLWADLSFAWFADWHSFYAVIFSRLMMKKSVVVAGGYDTANMPEINFGLMIRPFRKYIVKLTLKLCNRIITHSKWTTRETARNVGVDLNKVITVYLGLDSEFFKMGFNYNKEIIVLTVGGLNRTTVRQKGQEVFVRSAKYLPNVKFVLAGPWLDESINYLRSIAPSNVILTGHLSDEELLEYYQKAKVYVQISLHEGFGLALAEAMLCKCVPVVTQVGSIPEVVGECGFYVQPGDPAETAQKITMALSSDLGRKARERIVEEFPLQERKTKLTSIIEEVLRG
jgi:glycosyltransferase involved in cell wall biosynthesis